MSRGLASPWGMRDARRSGGRTRGSGSNPFIKLFAAVLLGCSPACSLPEFSFVEALPQGLEPSCENARQDGDESDSDCGGPVCAPCVEAASCRRASDCVSAACSDGRCAKATCADGVKNGSETDGDCGGQDCPPCSSDERCVIASDCLSGECLLATCLSSCADGLANCDENVNNGCEARIRTDAANCGACSTACVFANASAACAGGSCRVATCDVPFQDCNGDPRDGCEVNVRTDATNCGRCGALCPAVHGGAFCGAAECQIQCEPGFADCDDDRANGCEKDVTRDSANCHECGVLCSETVGTAWCRAGECGETVCAGGTGDCNGDVADGCETDLRTDADNCQTCGSLCVVASGTAECDAGLCAIAECHPGRADCTGGYADGCETDTLTSLDHCGRCGNTCEPPNGTGICDDGVCEVKACSSPFADCNAKVADGCEVDTSSNDAECGGCSAQGGSDCRSIYARALSHCSDGACVFDTCAAGYADCNDDLGDGCEVQLASDELHCGTCAVACSVAAGSHVTSNECVAGGCKPVCTGSFADCDGQPSNGCERSVGADRFNCGGCGVECGTEHATSTACFNGACQPACATGWASCSAPEVGCTRQLGTAAHCRSCTEQCVGSTPICLDFGCATTACDGPEEFTDADRRRCYLAAATTKSWPAAQAACQAWGGSLAAIGTSAEVDLVRAQLAGGSWIGGTDSANEGAFVWISGEPWSFTNWSSGEPNNSFSNENCVQLMPDGHWNDLGCTIPLGYVCEKAMR